MTVSSAQPTVVDSIDINDEQHQVESSSDLVLPMPSWVTENRSLWGDRVTVPEWDLVDEGYRSKHGWKGSDLVHDRHAPVRVVDYYIQYGVGEGLSPTHGHTRGGLETTLTGVVHFTKRAESHAGFCHGGSMCSVMDDVIGWCAFFITGKCQPWSGFTVQVNTRLQKPIPVQSYLLVQATICNIERRKVSIQAKLIDPRRQQPDNEEGALHAVADGLVILNHGVL